MTTMREITGEHDWRPGGVDHLARLAGISNSADSYETIADAKPRLFSHNDQEESETIAD